MNIRSTRFNIYLMLSLATALIGCRTPEERKHSKEASTLRIFVQAPNDGSARSSTVVIYRDHPIRLNMEREPLLSEADVETAAVVDMPGGYAIQIQFNGHGALILEGATVAHKSQHLGIQSYFGESRWLAAPLITRRISNGELVFTPDATREESERIVRGLVNVVTKAKSQWRWP
jgi:hypothetical protein